MNPLTALKSYNKRYFRADFIAAIIVVILLIPQSMGYALLAGLPAQAGIYAAIFPAMAYGILGTSRFLSVGPVAMTSLMTLSTISGMPEELRIVSAAILALMTGGFLVILGIMRAGALASFFSRPVVSAYITGAAILIIISQMKHILQIPITGGRITDMVLILLTNLHHTHWLSIGIGLFTIIALWFISKYAKRIFLQLGLRRITARTLTSLGPIYVITLLTVLSTYFNWHENFDLNVVGEIPSALPHIQIPQFSLQLWLSLAFPAFLIALVGFVDSISVGQTLAAKTRAHIDPNRELFAVGAANIMAGLSHAYPVAGSLSRSALSYTSQTKTRISGLLTALLMALAVLTIVPLLTYLPLAALSGLIMFSCRKLLNFHEVRKIWKYSQADSIAALVALLAVLFLGVQYGVLLGTLLSIFLHIGATLKPHVVEVGRFAGTQHYRDADRYPVETFPTIKTLRIDESLYFANARFLENTISSMVIQHPKMRHLILMCPAVNRIDASALSSLLEINDRLDSLNIKLHLSEVHVHLYDKLQQSEFFNKLSGQVFISQHEAIETLRPDPDWSQFSDHIDMH